MHYYQFNIGDYHSHTARLTPVQDIAYRRMLDEYYLHERPLNGCSTDVAREIGLQDYADDVAYILNKYFRQDGDCWVQNRADREILAYQDKREKAVKAGKASAKAKAQRTLNVRSTDVQPNNKQEPLTINHIDKAQTRKRFEPPTIELVYAYMIEKGFDKELQAVKFVNHHTAGGWVVGKKKMVDWKAAVRIWIQNYCEWN